MKAYKDFIVSPIGERYNNSKKVGDKELILNTEIFNHQFINRLALVLETPILFDTPISKRDQVILHHNVFRRWHDVKGREKNSRSYWKEDKYIISADQIFLYKKKDWMAMPGYSFVQPIISSNNLTIEEEEPLMGIIKYSDGTYNKEELVGFTPSSEYEFIIEGKRLYRVLNKFITIKYEYQGNEKEYNPSWAQSS
tara:strand:- start:1097 stop:1684 length:588 start_codon:yes stop_codon:yes gene_type:complete